MQIFNLRYQLHIHRHQVIVVLLLLSAILPARAQQVVKENLIDYDAQWIHYGFLIGMHESRYRIQYADIYADPSMDSLHSIVPSNRAGWKVGFVVDMSLQKYLSFRVLPTVGFYEYELTYRYTDLTNKTEIKPVTTVELPLMLKYKSARRGNIGMYITGGINPSIEAAGKGDQYLSQSNLELKNFNIATDVGLGFDLYFPYFKFSPEVRYSWGMRNMLSGHENAYSTPLQRLTYENMGFFMTFEGGPSYMKSKKKKK